MHYGMLAHSVWLSAAPHLQELIPAASRLAELHLLGSKALHLSLTLARARSDACMQPFALLMAATIVAIGLCYGLDGRQLGPLSGMGTPPDWGAWSRQQVARRARALAWPLSAEQVRR